MAKFAVVAEVNGWRANWAFSVVSEAFVAERSALHKLMVDFAAIAEQFEV